MPQKVQFYAVTRLSLRLVTPVVKQEDVNKKKKLEIVQHALQVAVFKEDSICNNLFCISLYDTKLLYFLPNTCTEVKFVIK